MSGRVYDMLHSTGIGGYLIPDERLTWVLRDMRALWADGPAKARPAAGLASVRKSDSAVNVRDAFYEVLRAMGSPPSSGIPGSNELPLL